MKNFLLSATAVLVLAFLLPAPASADPASFPSGGFDAQSLGRGGTVIACQPGAWSIFGNPATITPEDSYKLGIHHLDTRDVSKNSLGLSIVDTSSSIRGAAAYFKDPEFASFTNEMWGVSFSQTLARAFYLGESFHMGEYEKDASPGSVRTLSSVDVGLLYRLGPKVSIGYVTRNLMPNDSDLLEQFNGVGIAMQLPKTIYFTADYEEDPVLTDDNNLRTGLEFNPTEKFTGRLGYQDLASGDTYLTMGFTYADMNGSLDAAILYDDKDDDMVQLALGLSMKL